MRLFKKKTTKIVITINNMLLNLGTKNTPKLCLYAFLLRFYEFEKNLEVGGGFKHR